MRAVICDGFDGPRALRIGERPEPARRSGCVLPWDRSSSRSAQERYQLKMEWQ